MDDLISRAVLNDAIEKEYDGVCVYDVSGTEVIRDFQNIVDIQPAVDAVPVVHAKWHERRADVLQENAIDAWQSAKCSACGLYHTTPYLYYFNDYKFCPNCGAKMIGDDNG